MFHGTRRPQANDDAKTWHTIIQAWCSLPEDEEAVLVSDIVPMGFSEAELSAGYQKRAKMTWVWRKA